MREIKFRAWDGKTMRTWGFMQDHDLPMFKGPPAESGAHQYPHMQFTGLRDKNGTEIYEGDICRHRFYQNESYRIFEVEYVDGGFHYSGRSDNHWFMLNTGDNFEVIGNIYENPELLK